MKDNNYDFDYGEYIFDTSDDYVEDDLNDVLIRCVLTAEENRKTVASLEGYYFDGRKIGDGSWDNYEQYITAPNFAGASQTYSDTENVLRNIYSVLYDDEGNFNYSAPILIIELIKVENEYRNRGIFIKLYERLIEEIKSRRFISAIFVHIAPLKNEVLDNSRMIKLFEKQGYEMLEDVEMDNIMMLPQEWTY